MLQSALKPSLSPVRLKNTSGNFLLYGYKSPPVKGKGFGGQGRR
jgi:hypothetical protein